MLTCFTLSPALILASGQSLKDQFFVAWLVVSSLAVAPVVRWLAGLPVSRAALGAGIPLLVVAVAIVSGLRPYVALFIVVKLVDDTVIQPLTIGRSVHLHPVLLIASVVAGGQALGVLGMVIAVPVATVLQETIRLWLEHRRALAGYFPHVEVTGPSYFVS